MIRSLSDRKESSTVGVPCLLFVMIIEPLIFVVLTDILSVPFTNMSSKKQSSSGNLTLITVFHEKFPEEDLTNSTIDELVCIFPRWKSTQHFFTPSTVQF